VEDELEGGGQTLGSCTSFAVSESLFPSLKEGIGVTSEPPSNENSIPCPLGVRLWVDDTTGSGLESAPLLPAMLGGL
jgi:hypothetical protein